MKQNKKRKKISSKNSIKKKTLVKIYLKRVNFSNSKIFLNKQLKRLTHKLIILINNHKKNNFLLRFPKE